ncbi:hypothetical protein Acr_14g0008530 [Actinidia rufa]|uniref:Uncharacterized protein n=1 Tax=Actinidia rufa TaxID=165716 RepID=A0A7J0FTF6_9ERIC|nr:hypothetical protein Acr_14g0008530 [Actinidia rufa]
MHRATGHKQVETSSPPRRPAYYEQTLLRDSYDDDKTATTASFHSTPVLNPAGLPPHSHSSSTVGRHSASPPPADSPLDLPATAAGKQFLKLVRFTKTRPVH